MGSKMKAKASVPFFTNLNVQPSRVELQAGRFRVMSADNVPTYVTKSVSAIVEVAVTVL